MKYFNSDNDLRCSKKCSVDYQMAGMCECYGKIKNASIAAKSNSSENMNISKELFIESIEAIRSQYDHDRKCGDAFQLILPNDHISSYDNHWANNQLTKLLQVATNDNHSDSWIEYFIWELDFGKKQSNDFCARDKDGGMIDLSTPESLWNFLAIAHQPI